LEIKDYIKVYDNIIEYQTLSNILRYANTLDFNAATVGSNNDVRLDIRNTYSYGLSNLSEKLTDVHWNAYFVYIFDLTFKRYQKEFNHAHFNQIETVEILKYNEGGFYKNHVDHFWSHPRTLSGILLLNNDYEGGEFIFDLKNEKVQFPQNVGDCLIFPSNFMFPHRVNKITKGTRYALIAWAN